MKYRNKKKKKHLRLLSRIFLLIAFSLASWACRNNTRESKAMSPATKDSLRISDRETYVKAVKEADTVNNTIVPEPVKPDIKQWAEPAAEYGVYPVEPDIHLEEVPPDTP